MAAGAGKPEADTGNQRYRRYVRGRQGAGAVYTICNKSRFKTPPASKVWYHSSRLAMDWLQPARRAAAVGCRGGGTAPSRGLRAL